MSSDRFLCGATLSERIGGVLPVAGGRGGLYWIATGIIPGFVAGSVLPIEILR